MEAASTLENGHRPNLGSPMFLSLTSISMKLAEFEATQLLLATKFIGLPSYSVSIMEAASTLENGRRPNLESPMFLSLTSISMKLAEFKETQCSSLSL